MTRLPGPLHAALGLFDYSFALSPRRSWSGWALFTIPKVGCKSSLAGFPTNFCATLPLQKGTSPGSNFWRNMCCCLAMCHLWDQRCPRQIHPLLAPPTLCLPYNSNWAMLRSWVPSETKGAANQATFFSVCWEATSVPWIGSWASWHSRGWRVPHQLDKQPRCWVERGELNKHQPQRWCIALSQPSSAGEKIAISPLHPTESAQKWYSSYLQKYCVIIIFSETTFLHLLINVTISRVSGKKCPCLRGQLLSQIFIVPPHPESEPMWLLRLWTMETPVMSKNFIEQQLKKWDFPLGMDLPQDTWSPAMTAKHSLEGMALISLLHGL